MLITGGFWSAFCLITTYAAVFLQGAGYSNSELGIIMAAGNVCGAFLGPALGAWIDRDRRIRHSMVILVLLLIQTALIVFLCLAPERSAGNCLLYILYMTCLIPVNSINVDLCTRIQHEGAAIDFGKSRAIGSLVYTIVSVILGFLTQRFSYRALLYAGLVLIAVQILGNALIGRDLLQLERSSEKSSEKSGKADRRAVQSSSMTIFFRENKRFAVLMSGVVLLFISHSIDGNFMINEVKNLGGGTAVMGSMAAFQAMVEIPVMFFAANLPKKWNYGQYLRISYVFFAVKILACALAANIPMLFGARLFQAPGYALYQTMIVLYIDQVIPHKDSAKAQSLAFSMANAGTVLASLVGGVLFDAFGVRATILISAAIAAAGAVIAWEGTATRRGELSKDPGRVQPPGETLHKRNGRMGDHSEASSVYKGNLR